MGSRRSTRHDYHREITLGKSTADLGCKRPIGRNVMPDRIAYKVLTADQLATLEREGRFLGAPVDLADGFPTGRQVIWENDVCAVAALDLGAERMAARSSGPAGAPSTWMAPSVP